jgi:hypothetical protein
MRIQRQCHRRIKPTQPTTGCITHCFATAKGDAVHGGCLQTFGFIFSLSVFFYVQHNRDRIYLHAEIATDFTGWCDIRPVFPLTCALPEQC